MTGATDVFALGSTLTYAATGDTPFGSGSSEVMLYRVVHEEPDLEAVPPALAPLIRMCLSKEPAERPSPARLFERLRELVAQGAAIDRAASPRPLPSAAARRAPLPPTRREAHTPSGRRSERTTGRRSGRRWPIRLVTCRQAVAIGRTPGRGVRAARPRPRVPASDGPSGRLWGTRVRAPRRRTPPRPARRSGARARLWHGDRRPVGSARPRPRDPPGRAPLPGADA
ncbi:hypothetical protein ACFQZC_06755 [Streptacidiphilus monticola]